jgi:hypothetical protein
MRILGLLALTSTLLVGSAGLAEAGRPAAAGSSFPSDRRGGNAARTAPARELAARNKSAKDARRYGVGTEVVRTSHRLDDGQSTRTVALLRPAQAGLPAHFIRRQTSKATRDGVTTLRRESDRGIGTELPAIDSAGTNFASSETKVSRNPTGGMRFEGTATSRVLSGTKVVTTRRTGLVSVDAESGAITEEHGRSKLTVPVTPNPALPRN